MSPAVFLSEIRAALGRLSQRTNVKPQLRNGYYLKEQVIGPSVMSVLERARPRRLQIERIVIYSLTLSIRMPTTLNREGIRRWLHFDYAGCPNDLSNALPRLPQPRILLSRKARM